MLININSIVDQVITYLEEQIITGKLEPGAKIKEEEIATLLQVSRPPIREAIKALEANGLIVRKPRIGAFVTEIKSQDIVEIYTIKSSLYQVSHGIAIDRMDEHWLSKFEQCVQEMERYVKGEAPNVRRYQAAHEKFHGLAIDMAGNQRLKKIVGNLNKQVKRFSYISLGDRKHLNNSCSYHRQIIKAFKAKDKGLALRLIDEHIMLALNKLVSLFESNEIDQKVKIG